MKKNLIATQAFAVFCLFLILPSLCAAQRVAGGYKEISKTDETAVAAADFAVGAQAAKGDLVKFVSIERVQRQIVAGSNYRLCLVVNSGNARQEATAVIYHNLQNEFELTSWTPGKCSPDSKANSNQTSKIVPAANLTNAAPDVVVKNLYAEHNAGKGPFNQNKSRAVIDKYFTRNLGDIIWKIESDKNSAGFNFDPLYYSQDTQITGFVIGKADKNSVVKVKFKNFGKDEEVIFSLTKETIGSKAWKIDSINYSDAENLGDLLEYGMMTEAERKAAERENKFDGDYLIGGVKCSFTENKGGYWARVKCDDQENTQIIDTETLTFGLWKADEKGRRGQFIRATDGSISEFVDASGKKTKVTRINNR